MIVVPNQLQTILPFGRALDIGVLYYVYMGMMVNFYTAYSSSSLFFFCSFLLSNELN